MQHQRLKTVAAATLALAATLATALPAQAAAFLRFDGVKGESQTSASVGEWRWLQALSDNGQFNGFATSFAGGVRVSTGDLNGVDRLDSLTLMASDIDPGAPVFYKYELKNVLVSSYSVSGGSQAPVSFELTSLGQSTMSWRPLLATGERGDWIEGTWDRDTGRFIGDLAVLGAFDELGAERWADGTLAITAAVPEPGSWALMLLGAAVVGARLRRQRLAT